MSDSAGAPASAGDGGEGRWGRTGDEGESRCRQRGSMGRTYWCHGGGQRLGSGRVGTLTDHRSSTGWSGNGSGGSRVEERKIMGTGWRARDAWPVLGGLLQQGTEKLLMAGGDSSGSRSIGELRRSDLARFLSRCAICVADELLCHHLLLL